MHTLIRSPNYHKHRTTTSPPPSHQVEANIARCPDEATAEKMIARIDEIRKTGNSVGGAFAFCVHTSFVIVVGILFFAFVRVVWGDVA